MMPSISVVIPTLGRTEELRRCLEALDVQTHRCFEVVVAFDGPGESARSMISELRPGFDISVVELPRVQGPAMARNVAAAAARGKVLAFLDDDMVPDPCWVAEHEAGHVDCNNVSCVVIGQIVEEYTRPADDFVEQSLRKRHAEEFARTPAEISSRPLRFHAMSVSCGASTSLPKELYLSMGGQDSRLRCNEDVELGARLFSAGVPFVFRPKAIVRHINSKYISSELQNVSRDFAAATIHRVFCKHQRNPQTRPLAFLSGPTLTSSVDAALAWNSPALARRCADVARFAANRLRSELLSSAWQRLESAAAFGDEFASRELKRSKFDAFIGHRLPILMFHSVSNGNTHEGAIAPRRFRRFADSARLFTSSTDLSIVDDAVPPHRLVLTFDDGYMDFYTEAAQILHESGLTATLFVVAGLVGKTNVWDEGPGRKTRALMDWPQLKELHGMGFSIQCHSMTHPVMTDGRTDLQREIVDSKHLIEDKLGSAVTEFAYPFGYLDSRIKTAIIEAGYRHAVSTVPGLSFWDDPYALPRIGVSNHDSLLDFVLKLRFGASLIQRVADRVRTTLNRGMRPAVDQDGMARHTIEKPQ